MRDRVARQEADMEIELVERHLLVGRVGVSLDNLRWRLVELVVGCLGSSRVTTLSCRIP